MNALFVRKIIFDYTLETKDRRDVKFIQKLKGVIKYGRIVIWPNHDLSYVDAIILFVIVTISNVKHFL
jgi:hypothetical protein